MNKLQENYLKAIGVPQNEIDDVMNMTSFGESETEEMLDVEEDLFTTEGAF